MDINASQHSPNTDPQHLRPRTHRRAGDTAPETTHAPNTPTPTPAQKPRSELTHERSRLEVQDLTLSNHAGTVGAVTVTRTKDRKNGVWVTDTPKTEQSIRTVPLDAWRADDLRDYLTNTHQNNQPHAPLFPGRLTLQRAKELGHNVKDRANLFDYTQPIDVGNVTLRYFRPALAALDLPRARWHDLRHSFAVMSLSAGEHFMQVSKMLGHSTFVLTLNTYGDYITADEGGKAAPLSRPQAQKPDNKVVPIERASG